MVLDLSVLDRTGPQELVQLHGVHSGRPLLILAGLGADPVVDVIEHSTTHLPGLKGRGDKAKCVYFRFVYVCVSVCDRERERGY